MWERYQWVTTDLDSTGTSSPLFAAVYNDITSNRMYGVNIGQSSEWYIGKGFACHLDLQAALFLDSVNMQAEYRLFDKFTPPDNKRSRKDWTAVPEIQATAGLMWYPSEGIQVFAGYDVMCFFNTYSQPKPIDFNYSSISPHWDSTFRLFDGFKAGVAFIF
jgi:hypothetical protein